MVFFELINDLHLQPFCPAWYWVERVQGTVEEVLDVPIPPAVMTDFVEVVSSVPISERVPTLDMLKAMLKALRIHKFLLGAVSCPSKACPEHFESRENQVEMESRRRRSDDTKTGTHLIESMFQADLMWTLSGPCREKENPDLHRAEKT